MRPAISLLRLPYEQVPLRPVPSPLEAAKKTVSKPVLVEQYGKDKLQFGELRLPAGKGPFPVVAVGFSMESYEAKSKAAGDDLRIIATNPEDHFDMITAGQAQRRRGGRLDGDQPLRRAAPAGSTK